MSDYFCGWRKSTRRLVLDLDLKMEKIMAALDTITQKLTDLEGVEEGVIQLLATLSADLKAAAADPAAVQAIVDRLDADRVKLADAIAANTPAA